MKTLIMTLAASCLVLAAANAGKSDKEEVTVTGAVKCAHCDLKIGDSCQSAIQTTDNTIYIFEGKVAEKFFEDNEDVKAVTATGTARKHDDHILLKATKIEAAG